jgi:Tfp pilus assembly protein PilV
MNFSRKRAGFSLMEVLLATAILLGSILVLMELAGIGRYYIRSVEHLSEAQLLCQSKLNELLAGLAPLEEVQDRPVPDHADWEYSVEIRPVSGLEVSLLRVTVTEVRRSNEATQELRGRPKTFTLSRWIPNPQGNSARRSFVTR